MVQSVPHGETQSLVKYQNAQAALKRVLKILADLFDASDVHIDTTVGNPSRLVKIVGTVVAKGDHTGDRPWRRAEAVCHVQ